MDITARKQVEDALRESEELYRRIVDTAYEGIWVVDDTYRTTFLNARMEEMLGYSAAEVIGKRVDTFMFETDAETDYQQLNQRLHRIGVQHERRFRRKDGSELWTLVSSKPIIDNQNVFKGSFAMFSDITERKQAEDALKASQQQLERQKLFLEAMLSAMPIPVFYKDTQGRYLGCNRAYTEVMGIELTEFKGKTVYDLWPHELAETYHRMDMELFENPGPQIYEAKVRNKSGEMRDVIFRKDVFRNDDGSIGGIIGTHFDITERKQTEERIAKERENFLKIFAAAPVGLLLLDYNTVITKANQSVADMILHNPVDIIGKRAGEGWGCVNSQESPKGCGFGKNCSNCVLRQGLESVLAGGPSLQGAEIALTLLINGQFQKRWLSIGAEPIELDGKRHIVVAINDITERKQAEAALRSSLAEKESLLKEVHHRVKNNLQIITSLLNMQADSSKNEAVTSALEESKNRVRSMALIHEKLYRSQNLEYIQAADYVPELVGQLGSAFSGKVSGITFDVQAENVSFDINTAIPCGMIITELVSNALKYAFPNHAQGIIKVYMESKDGKTRLMVSDNGVGLPAEIDIRHPETLGLELVGILSHQLRAELEVIRQPGATFTIVF
jgi:PAS domain S-box-containing protein